MSASTLDSHPPKTSSFDLESARTACRRIAPLWPLTHFVAVNPFLGMADQPFIETCDLLRKLAPGGMQMSLSFYAQKHSEQEIKEDHLDAALKHSAEILPPAWSALAAQMTPKDLIAELSKSEADFDTIEILTVADALDLSADTTWNTHVIEVISQFCAGYYDNGQSAWQQPWRDQPLFTAWRETASLDAKPEFQGLKNFRQHVKSLPKTAEDAITHALEKLGVPADQTTNFLHRQLMSISGWAGHVQYLVRENGMAGREDDSVLDLLAIRLAYDTALLAQFDSPALREHWNPAEAATTAPSQAVLVRFLWQLAHEKAWQDQLTAQLATSKPASKGARPAAQAVFCIDVRSEVFRRGLEAANPDIQTMGFAGFFGMAIKYVPFGQHHGQTQCPVLLNPAYQIREIPTGADEAGIDEAWRKQRLSKRLRYSWNSFKGSAISCFSFVETAGIAFAPKLFKNSFAPSGAPSKCAHDFEPTLAEKDGDATGIPFADRIALAAGALSHMGLKENFARLVLICGHGSETTNNPYGSGLDCGACGGHAGDANARVAAAILNDAKVREAIIEKGIEIPDDTIFLAGLHNTTTDDVTIFDTAQAAKSHAHDLEDLRASLAQAGRTARLERSLSLGLSAKSATLDSQVRTRAHDWAEVRPEWGLAGNAAFIAAPRARTKHAKLGGRVFLHDYNHSGDVDEATLELILIAPMVVGSWINLQYYASTVNNRVFGSGNKVTHNVTSTLGVCQGNVGDLQTGLPIQSVHDGEKWIHEPLRLHVLVEAPRESIRAILDKHPGVRDLVTNGWVLLFALEDEGKTLHPIR